MFCVRFSVSFIKTTWHEMTYEKPKISSDNPTKGFVTCNYTNKYLGET